MPFFAVACARCGSRTRWSASDALSALQRLGMLKRATHQDGSLLEPLLKASQNQLACPHCGGVGLHLHSASEEDADDALQWPEARACRTCREPIPAERLEIFPDAILCARCQEKTDRGGDVTEADFCPRCGDRLDLRTTASGGLTHYRLVCRSCRNR